MVQVRAPQIAVLVLPPDRVLQHVRAWGLQVQVPDGPLIPFEPTELEQWFLAAEPDLTPEVALNADALAEQIQQHHARHLLLHELAAVE